MNDAGLLPNPGPRLVEAFCAIHEQRMRSLPFLNPAIEVEAVAFAPWKTCWLGVMLTPWSMALMLTPREIATWRPLAVGEKRRYTFPAGPFDFISAELRDIGAYLTCSLFSPVLEFADHASARQTAEYARAALFQTELGSDVYEDRGQSFESATPRKTEPGAATPIDVQLDAPMSRRDLLHARVKRS
ncbi:MAG TPA: [NiFe]-hydrogenase assembly chaperone HybE [Casimicrobiaceae bacterium]|nr:[NiFe]-hydrogenase assembly chaperone HybE [Casimicrobiaceae bacterium]